MMQLGDRGDLKLGAGERQQPHNRVPEPADPLGRARDLLPGPEGGELGAEIGQPADVLLPLGVADVRAVCRRSRAARSGTSSRNSGTSPAPRLGDAATRQVLMHARHGVPVPEQILVGGRRAATDPHRAEIPAAGRPWLTGLPVPAWTAVTGGVAVPVIEIYLGPYRDSPGSGTEG
jgi:hypothetical protein